MLPYQSDYEKKIDFSKQITRDYISTHTDTTAVRICQIELRLQQNCATTVLNMLKTVVVIPDLTFSQIHADGATCLPKCDWWMTLQYVTSEHETLEFGRLIPKSLGQGNMENLVFRHGRIFLAKCDLYHSIHIDDLHQ